MPTQQKKIMNTIILISLVTILLTMSVSYALSYFKATNELVKGEKEAITIAKKQANLQTVDQFYWFTREKTYFTVTGTNDQEQSIAVFIPKDGEIIQIVNQKDGLAEMEVKQLVETKYNEHEIKKINLGIYQKKPVWEVVTMNEYDEYTYYLLSFADGEEINIIHNI